MDNRQTRSSVAVRNEQPLPTARHADLRSQRTRAFIKAALLELAQTKSFDRISVQEIARRALVNRATFYRYYPDKYRLVEEIFKAALHKLALEMGSPLVVQEAADLARALGSVRIQQAWVNLFEHFAAHSRIYVAILTGKGGVWFQARMREDLMQFFKGRIRGRTARPDPEQVPAQVARCFYASAIVGVVYWWLVGGLRHPPQKVATWFRQIAYKGFIGSLAGLNQ